MALAKKPPIIRSPLLGAINNIVNIKRSSAQMTATKNSLDDFIRFMNVEVKSLEAIKLPDQKKLSKLSTISMPSTFGRPGSLLASLFSGALDVGGFIGNFFRGKGDPSPKAGKPIPKSKGVRLGGFKAAGIMNAVFAGLDFKEGIDSGESTSLAAAGAGGALAGSLLGGAIGQALIPVPGLGFMLGSMAGNFLGGWAADRAHEAITGSGGVEEKQEEKLAQAEAEQKASAASVGTKTSFSSVLDQFDEVVYLFERSLGQMVNAASAATSGGDAEQNLEWGAEYPDDQQGAGQKFGSGSLESVTAEGGRKPSTVIKTSPFGPRWGRNHNGNDYAGAGVDHEPVSVIQQGKVGWAGPLGTAGNAVVIDHPDGSTSKYFHLADNSIKVSVGQDIVPGQVIGTVGNTGRSTGTHLHFEIWKNGKAIDPSAEADNYFRFGGNVKVTPKATAGASAPGAPTLVIAAGTNNFGDQNTATAKAALKKTISDAQAKGYNVVYIPPNSEGEFANISAALSETATASGATIERAQYGTGDRQSRAHFAAGESDRIRSKYQGATFMGDSNAAGLGGEKSGMRVTSERMENIAGFTQNLPTAAKTQPAAAAPTTSANPPGALVAGQRPDKSLTSAQWRVQQQARKDAEAMGLSGAERDRYIASKVMGVPQQPVSPNQVSRYPEYNVPSQQIAIFPQITPGQSSRKGAPVMSSSSGGGGGGQISEGQSPSQLLNSYFTTALLTNLSST